DGFGFRRRDAARFRLRAGAAAGGPAGARGVVPLAIWSMAASSLLNSVASSRNFSAYSSSFLRHLFRSRSYRVGRALTRHFPRQRGSRWVPLIARLPMGGRPMLPFPSFVYAIM